MIWNGKKCDQKWFSVIQNGRWQPFCEKKKVAYWSEMVRNAIKSDFRSYKMAAGSHFVKKIIKVAYWSEMSRNPIESDFRSSKMAAGSHFVKKNKSCVLIWNGEKCDRKWFSVIQNGRRQPFCEQNIKNWVLIRNGETCDRSNGRRQPFCGKKVSLFLWNGEKCDQNSFSVIQNGGWGGGGALQWPGCKPFGDIHSICPWANTSILVIY